MDGRSDQDESVIAVAESVFSETVWTAGELWDTFRALNDEARVAGAALSVRVELTVGGALDVTLTESVDISGPA